MIMIDSYDKLPIGLYLQLCDADERAADDLERMTERVALLSGMSEQDVLNLELPEFQKRCEVSRFLERDAPTGKLADKYSIGDFVLIPCRDMRKMTAGQYIDYQAYCKQKDVHIVDILSCFLVPKGMKYNDGYDIEGVKTAISDNLSVVEVNALFSFFVASLLSLTQASLSCSERAAMKMKDSPKKTEILKELATVRDSLRNGAGFDSLTWSRKLHDTTGIPSSE